NCAHSSSIGHAGPIIRGYGAWVEPIVASYVMNRIGNVNVRVLDAGLRTPEAELASCVAAFPPHRMPAGETRLHAPTYPAPHSPRGGRRRAAARRSRD